MSASGRPRVVAVVKNELFAPVCIPAPPVGHSAPPSARTAQVTDGFHCSRGLPGFLPSSLSRGRTSSAGNTTPCLSSLLFRCSFSPVGGAAFLSPAFTVVCFPMRDERRAKLPGWLPSDTRVSVRTVAACRRPVPYHVTSGLRQRHPPIKILNIPAIGSIFISYLNDTSTIIFHRIYYNAVVYSILSIYS